MHYTLFLFLAAHWFGNTVYFKAESLVIFMYCISIVSKE